jgi:hypothetical protein
MQQMSIKPLPLAFMLFALNSQAQDAAQLMQDLSWEKRVLVIFAPDSSDPDLILQNTVLSAEQSGLIERHMTVIRVFADNRVSVDGESHDDTGASFHQRFDAAPDRFRVLLVGKDGGVKLDRDTPVSTGKLFSLIDSMPMRQHEMQQGG